MAVRDKFVVCALFLGAYTFVNSTHARALLAGVHHLTCFSHVGSQQRCRAKVTCRRATAASGIDPYILTDQAPKVQLPAGKATFLDPPAYGTLASADYQTPDVSQEASKLLIVLEQVNAMDIATAVFIFIALGCGLLDTKQRWFSILWEEITWVLYSLQSNAVMPAVRVPSPPQVLERVLVSWSAVRSLGRYIGAIAPPEDHNRAVEAADTMRKLDPRLEPLALAICEAVTPVTPGTGLELPDLVEDEDPSVEDVGAVGVYDAKGRGEDYARASAALFAEAVREISQPHAVASATSREALAVAWDNSRPRRIDGVFAQTSMLPKLWSNAGVELRMALGLTVGGLIPQQVQAASFILTSVIYVTTSLFLSRLLTVALSSDTDALTWSFFVASFAIFIDLSVEQRRAGVGQFFRPQEERERRERRLAELSRWADGHLLRKGATSRDDILFAVRRGVQLFRIEGEVTNGEIEDLLKVWHPTLKRGIILRGNRTGAFGGRKGVVSEAMSYRNLSLNPNPPPSIWR